MLSTPDAPGSVSRERLATCLRLMAHDLRVDVGSLPHIVVMHANRPDAEAAGMRETGIRHNTGNNGSTSDYYEFWIIGRPRTVDYTAGLYGILENHLGGLKLPQEERLAIMGRALRYLDATVSASALGE